MYRKYWLTTEEYESLEPSMQVHYVADGREYRLRSDPGEDRSFKISMIVLGILAGSSSLLGAYGVATDHWTLEILAFCVAMPTLFGFLVQLAMFFSSD
jgi:hypothetical protein